jgi:hypothetical protein
MICQSQPSRATGRVYTEVNYGAVVERLHLALLAAGGTWDWATVIGQG